MPLLQKRTDAERALVFSGILLAGYLIRIPVFPLLALLQQSGGNAVSFLLRALYLFSQTAAFFSPVYMFATALSLRHSGGKRAFGIFGIYALAELVFQLLYTVLSYCDAETEVLRQQLFGTLWQWLLFSAVMAVLLGAAVLFFPRKKRRAPCRFFAVKDPDVWLLLAFSLTFLAEKITVRVVRLYQSLDEVLWLEETDVRAMWLDILCYVLAIAVCFLLSRQFVRSDERRAA